VITPFAKLRGFLPRFGAVDIPVPKWPRFALYRAVFVNTAAACFVIEQYAIAVTALNQTFTESAYSLNKFACELKRRVVEPSRDLFDVGIGKPNVTRFASTTLSALRTLKPQTVFVPCHILLRVGK
jgi:hypothetical protein